MRRLVVGLVALTMCVSAGVMLAPATAGAATCQSSWAAPVNGQWNVAANWTNGVPTTVACIDVPGSYTVSVRGETFVDALRIGASSGLQTLDIAGNCTRAASLTVGGDNDVNSYVQPAGVIRLRDVGCNAGASLEADRKLVNFGLLDVEASSKDAGRHVDGNVNNRGTLRVGGAAQVVSNRAILSARAARLEVHLTSVGLPSMSSTYAERIPQTIAVVADPSFVPTQRVSWQFCSRCTRHATQISGTQLPNGFEIVFHFRRSHQLAAFWIQATIRRA